MPRRRLDPTQKTETLSVRVTRADFEKIKQIADDEDRPITSEARRLILAGLAQRAATTAKRATTAGADHGAK